MVDDEDRFVKRGSDFPGFAEELNGRCGTDLAGDMQREVKIQQSLWRNGAKSATVFLESFIPGFIGSQAGRTVAMGLIVVLDFILEELVGVIGVLDFIVGQQGDQTPLKGAKESFDFAFGLRRRSDAMINAQGGEGALKLAQGIQTILSRSVPKEAQAIGVEISRATVFFECRT